MMIRTWSTKCVYMDALCIGTTHIHSTFLFKSCLEILKMALSLDFETTMGPFSLLVWISFILYGLSLAQAYIYFRTYNDRIFLKLTVALLCALQTAQVAANFHFQYAQLILGFNHPEMLLKVLWSEIAALTLELVINALVQSFYIFRIWQLSKKNVPIAVYLATVLWARTG
ncbi:hypothetical protein BC629DRAFT_1455862, partial [Irpex lacteus]